MAIYKITSARLTNYIDNGQMTAAITWIDGKGKTGRTEGSPYNEHMQALLCRAAKQGIALEVHEAGWLPHPSPAWNKRMAKQFRTLKQWASTIHSNCK